MRNQRRELIQLIEQHRGSRVLCYLTGDRANAAVQVQKDALSLFYEHLRSIGPCARLDVVLHTPGGDTLAAFGLARLLREFCSDVRVLVPERCHSAGTLFALGANSIAMTRLATLSPIDPSLVGPLNPTADNGNGQRQVLPLGVESVAGFHALVRDEWGLKDEASLASALKVLAEKVHPLALGDVVRARVQIERLAQTLLRQHRTDAESITNIIATLARGLGSHDYLIARSEARSLLGAQVESDDPQLEELLWRLHEDFANELELRVPFDPLLALHAAAQQGRATNPLRLVQRLAFVESAHGSHVAEREVHLAAMQVMPQGAVGAAPQRVVQSEVVRAGWVFEPSV